MQLELTWVDIVLMVLLAASIVLGVRRGVSMLIVALGSLVVWIVLNILGLFFPPLGFAIALVAGRRRIKIIAALSSGHHSRDI